VRGGPALVALLDNIRSTFNVGAMMRTADGAGLRHLHLCGITATPTHRGVAKTALGAEVAVPWSYHRNGVDAACMLDERGYRLWALESRDDACSLFTVPLPMAGEAPLALVVGNERAGVDPGILPLCERIVHIPMEGIKESLNVAIAFGIAAYTIRFGTL
jgi:tRNA G18 (ribose-2'-O)-methylase SpoU